MARQGRLYFAQVFSKNPPSVDILREDKINGNYDMGESVTFEFQYNKRSPVEIVSGVILAKGMKVTLEKLHYDSNGKRLPDSATDWVHSRREETTKLRQQIQNARNSNLQHLGEELLTGGPDALPMPNVERPPKQRTAQELADIQKIIDDLPCFTKGTFKLDLLKKNVFVPLGKAQLMRQKFAEKPTAHFRKLMKHILQPLFGVNGISPTGKRGCVGVPSHIVETVLLYVIHCYTAAGHSRSDIKFNPVNIIGNLLDNAKRAKKQGRGQQGQGYLESSDDEMHENEDRTGDEDNEGGVGQNGTGSREDHNNQDRQQNNAFINDHNYKTQDNCKASCSHGDSYENFVPTPQNEVILGSGSNNDNDDYVFADISSSVTRIVHVNNY